jgi:RimJ/RimL family protein N-acetyltransferase/GNAT superfamily N-acetyltransferase
MQWIDKDLVLEGERVVLQPMTPEHVDGLVAAGSDKRIWEFLPVIPNEPSLRAYYDEAFVYQQSGEHFPFTIFDRDNNIIGTTRYGEIVPEHRRLEIGWTWYKPELWGKGYNEECKYLLLSHAFSVLKAIRVHLKTSDKNYRSRRAIQRLGCKFEGIYRNHLIRLGFIRNTAMFSMLPEEWEVARPALKAVIDSKYAGTYHYTPDGINSSFNGYTITTDKTRMQPEVVHAWLSTKSYWLPGISFETVKTAFDNSFCIAVLHDGVQVGYARFVTDYVIFAYLADVHVDEAHRGKGLSKKMMETLLALDWVKKLRKLVLMTRDAHGLYAQYGYTAPAFPERYMEIARTGALQ